MSICTKLPVILSALDYIPQTTTTFGSHLHYAILIAPLNLHLKLGRPQQPLQQPRPNRLYEGKHLSARQNHTGKSHCGMALTEGEDLQTRLPDHLLSLLFLGTL